MVAKGYAESELLRYQHLFDSCISAGEEQHERQIRALVNRPNALPLLAEIETPAILVAGEEDAWSTPQQHADMESKMVSSNQTCGVEHRPFCSNTKRLNFSQNPYWAG